MPVTIADPCPSCKKGQLVRDSDQRTMVYRGHTITYPVPGATCDTCGQRYVGPYGAGVAGDRVRAQEAVIDLQVAFLGKRSINTASAGPTKRPQKRKKT